MAADQRKKRVNAANLVGCTSREQHRVNRKKQRVQRHDLNMRPNINLEWDNKKKSVVSKREQVGITRRHLIPFIEPDPHGNNILADVFSVPREIFELENLSEVLSYEVWQCHLTDKERSFLSQFLPKESEPDTVVRDLLAGDNFHLGNPCIKWGASLCSGELHPDNVLQKERSLKAEKKAYYSDLQKYHNDMIDDLQMWKEKWASCKDPEVDIVHNMWSSRKHTETNMPPSETRLCGTEENLVMTPESCSWANSEIAYSSDNQNLGTGHGESRRRKDILGKLSDNTSSGLKVAVAVPKKGEKLHKRNIQHSDGAKYMSYIKVSREQHERVKSSMKHAGNSIQPRYLNNVLGSIDALNVQPFERFEEEESNKLHEYWLKLATKDIPESFGNWRKRQLQRQEVIQSLGEEMLEKIELQEITLDEEKEGSPYKQTEVLDEDEEEIIPSIPIEGVEEDQSDALLQEQKDNEEALNEIATEPEDVKEIKSDIIFKDQTEEDTEMIEDEDVAGHVFIQDHNQQQQINSLNNSPRRTTITPASPGVLQDQHQQQIGSLNSNSHTSRMEIQLSCSNAIAKTDEDDSPLVSEYAGNLSHVDIPVSQGAPLPSASEVWPVGDVHPSYYQSNVTNAGFSSSQELSIGHPHFIQEQAVRMLNLETDRQNKDTTKDLLHRQTDEMPFFTSYPNQDRNEFIQSLLKAPSNLPYHHQQKHSGLEFQPGNDLMMEAGQHFPGHFREQVHPSLPVDLRQKRPNDHLYMPQNVQESMYSGGRFAMPRQDDLPINIHDFRGLSMPVPSQPHLSSGVELNQNWYIGENGSRDGWSSLEVANHHSLSSGSNSDQTLFSVLSECSELRPRAGYETMGSTERLVQAGSYGGIGGGIPSTSNFLQQSPNPLNYLSGHDAAAAAGIKMNSVGWMGLPQPNSGIQESISKPFLRSWNQ